MSFRKRNAPVVGVRNSSSTDRNAPAAPVLAPPTRLPGTRPSPVDGRPVTSTGTATLDNLLAGHGGLALGTSLLIEENGATDYAGALLRFYAAEGLLQGHHVHVVGLPESWGRELPGQTTERKGASKEAVQETDRMKIAWRYEKLGQQENTSRGGLEYCFSTMHAYESPPTSLGSVLSLVIARRSRNTDLSQIEYKKQQETPLQHLEAKQYHSITDLT